MKKLELYLDLDNCLYPFAENAVRHYNIDFHDNVSPNDIKDYWFKECKKAPKQYFDLLFHKKDFFNELPPSGINVDYFNLFLDEGYSLKIITCPIYTSAHCMLEKVEWIHTYFPRFNINKDLYFGGSKGVFAKPNRILWDDDLIHLYNFHNNGGLSVCNKHGWSEEWNGLEAKNMKDLYELVKRIERKRKDG